MGEIGAGLSRTRTGPKFIKAPIFNNLILIKKRLAPDRIASFWQD